MSTRTALFVSSVDDIDRARAYLREHPDASLATFDFWAERELKDVSERIIPFTDFAPPETEAERWWGMAQDIAREWYRLPEMRFFTYRGVRIGEALEPLFERYLSKLLYYTRIFIAFKERYPETQVHVIAPSTRESPTAGPLASFEGWAIVEAARMSGLSGSLPERTIAPPELFPPRRLARSILTCAYNALVSFAPHRPLRIYASEYWSHIAPLLPYLPHAELVLMEGSELAHASWRDLWRHRIRVRHPLDETHVRARAYKTAAGYMGAWEENGQHAVRAYLASLDGAFDWSPVLLACARLIAYAPRIIADFEGFEQIYKSEKPSVVIQRASIGGRLHHFFLMAKAARGYSIPSVELQHAGAVFDPRSVHSRLETDYLAAYGTVEVEEYEKNGYSKERIVPIGSPRLDLYRDDKQEARAKARAALGLDESRPVVMITVPWEDATLSPLDFSSYEMKTFFESIKEVVQRVPQAQFLLKFRMEPGAAVRSFLSELFPNKEVMIVYGDPRPYLIASDIVASGNSTIMYEALATGRLLVLYPWKGWDYHLSLYERAAPHARSPQELGELLRRLIEDPSFAQGVREKNNRFAHRHAFDGASAKRTASFVSSLTV